MSDPAKGRYAAQARRDRAPDKWADLARGSNLNGITCMMAAFYDCEEVIEVRVFDYEANAVVQV